LLTLPRLPVLGADSSPAAELSAPPPSELSGSSAPADPPAELSAGAVEQLRAHLVEVSAALARYTAEADREVEQLRGTIAELSQRVERALESPGHPAATASAAEAVASAGTSPAQEPNLDALIQVAREAVEHPRHLDYVSALAERAGDVVQALENNQHLVATLEDLRRRLTELAGGRSAGSPETQ
jgi:hypothetical protein